MWWRSWTIFKLSGPERITLLGDAKSTDMGNQRSNIQHQIEKIDQKIEKFYDEKQAFASTRCPFRLQPRFVVIRDTGLEFSHEICPPHSRSPPDTQLQQLTNSYSSHGLYPPSSSVSNMDSRCLKLVQGLQLWICRCSSVTSTERL